MSVDVSSTFSSADGILTVFTPSTSSTKSFGKSSSSSPSSSLSPTADCSDGVSVSFFDCPSDSFSCSCCTDRIVSFSATFAFNFFSLQSCRPFLATSLSASREERMCLCTFFASFHFPKLIILEASRLCPFTNSGFKETQVLASAKEFDFSPFARQAAERLEYNMWHSGSNVIALEYSWMANS